MSVGVRSPDGHAGVMRDAAGHHGFRSFDDALVLWGGGDPGASCAKMKRRRQMRKHGKQNVLPEKNNTEEKKNNTSQKKLISVEMTCCCFVFCFLMASCRKHLRDDSGVAQTSAFVFEGIECSFYYDTARPRLSTSAKHVRLAIKRRRC